MADGKQLAKLVARNKHTLDRLPSWQKTNKVPMPKPDAPTSPQEAADTLAFEYYNDYAKAATYADKVASVDGPLDAFYRKVAAILRLKASQVVVQYTQAQAAAMYKALERIHSANWNPDMDRHELLGTCHTIHDIAREALNDAKRES